MRMWLIEFHLVVIFMAFVTSQALDNSVLHYKGGVERNQWLRSEQEMRWLYDEWIIDHDKAYGDIEEKENRFKIFRDNLEFIDEHNRPENNHTYTVGLNQFADLTDEEFQTLYLSPQANMSMESFPPVGSQYKGRRGQQLPASVDWRQTGAVSPVKNQGICQSCRAFATVAAVEGLYKILTGDMITLSEQELVDCDMNNRGCDPGYIQYSYQYIIDNGGIDTDANYPYTGVFGRCNPYRSRVVGISSFGSVLRNNEYALREAVANQPISIYIESKGRGFRFLKRGVFTGPCGTTNDHFVTAIGYGTEYPNLHYWLVKNSWGTTWGEGGIGKIQRMAGGQGRCGILRQSVYPVMNFWPSSERADA